MDKDKSYIKENTGLSPTLPSSKQADGLSVQHSKRKLFITGTSTDDDASSCTSSELSKETTAAVGSKRRRSSHEATSSDYSTVKAPRIVPLSERQQLALIMKECAGEVHHDPAELSPRPSSPHTSKMTPQEKKVSRRNAKGETPLHTAAIRGDLKEVKTLIKYGAGVNVQDHAGWTPLHEACNHGHFHVSRYLLKVGANVNVQGLDQDTPLHDASCNGHVKLVQLLLKHGANPLQLNARGKSPIDIAHDEQILKMLKNEIIASSSGTASSEILRSPSLSDMSADEDSDTKQGTKAESPLEIDVTCQPESSTSLPISSATASIVPTTTCALTPTSCTLTPTSCTLTPTSCTLTPTSSTLTPTARRDSSPVSSSAGNSSLDRNSATSPLPGHSGSASKFTVTRTMDRQHGVTLKFTHHKKKGPEGASVSPKKLQSPPTSSTPCLEEDNSAAIDPVESPDIYDMDNDHVLVPAAVDAGQESLAHNLYNRKISPSCSSTPTIRQEATQKVSKRDDSESQLKMARKVEPTAEIQPKSSRKGEQPSESQSKAVKKVEPSAESQPKSARKFEPSAELHPKPARKPELASETQLKPARKVEATVEEKRKEEGKPKKGEQEDEGVGWRGASRKAESTSDRADYQLSSSPEGRPTVAENSPYHFSDDSSDGVVGSRKNEVRVTAAATTSSFPSIEEAAESSRPHQCTSPAEPEKPISSQSDTVNESGKLLLPTDVVDDSKAPVIHATSPSPVASVELDVPHSSSLVSHPLGHYESPQGRIDHYSPESDKSSDDRSTPKVPPLKIILPTKTMPSVASAEVENKEVKEVSTLPYVMTSGNMGEDEVVGSSLQQDASIEECMEVTIGGEEEGVSSTVGQPPKKRSRLDGKDFSRSDDEDDLCEPSVSREGEEGGRREDQSERRITRSQMRQIRIPGAPESLTGCDSRDIPVKDEEVVITSRLSVRLEPSASAASMSTMEEANVPPRKRKLRHRLNDQATSSGAAASNTGGTLDLETSSKRVLVSIDGLHFFPVMEEDVKPSHKRFAIPRTAVDGFKRPPTPPRYLVMPSKLFLQSGAEKLPLSHRRPSVICHPATFNVTTVTMRVAPGPPTSGTGTMLRSALVGSYLGKPRQQRPQRLVQTTPPPSAPVVAITTTSRMTLTRSILQRTNKASLSGFKASSSKSPKNAKGRKGDKGNSSEAIPGVTSSTGIVTGATNDKSSGQAGVMVPGATQAGAMVPGATQAGVIVSGSTQAGAMVPGATQAGVKGSGTTQPVVMVAGHLVRFKTVHVPTRVPRIGHTPNTVSRSKAYKPATVPLRMTSSCSSSGATCATSSAVTTSPVHSLPIIEGSSPLPGAQTVISSRRPTEPAFSWSMALAAAVARRIAAGVSNVSTSESVTAVRGAIGNRIATAPWGRSVSGDDIRLIGTTADSHVNTNAGQWLANLDDKSLPLKKRRLRAVYTPADEQLCE